MSGALRARADGELRPPGQEVQAGQDLPARDREGDVSWNLLDLPLLDRGYNFLFRKAYEEVESGLKECCTEEYVDIDSYNEDSITLNSDEIHQEEEDEGEEEDSKY